MIHKNLNALNEKMREMDSLVERLRASFSYSTPAEMLNGAKRVYEIEREIIQLMHQASADLDAKGISSYPAFKHFREESH